MLHWVGKSLDGVFGRRNSEEYVGTGYLCTGFHFLAKKNSSRILHDTKTDCARTIHAGGHHQQFAVLDEFVRLGKIPDRPLRLVITPTAEDSTPCVFVGELFRPLPDVADQVHHT